ncbi:hypothetical protein MNV49_003611 [Pseudohyphozyma bogoriensis]|nr:hypothetical protein MNV49_003611 [Pseudohyphozyma bogoriensis]
MVNDPSSMNAKTKEETRAEGAETFGNLNQHPGDDHASPPPYRVGVSVDRNRKCRRTMEDAHSFIYDFAGIRGQGYFAVFDGHAGKHAAEWCGENFHVHLLDALLAEPTTPIPDLLNSTFHVVDRKLSELAASEKTHSGCTAVTAFLRLEDEHGNAVGNAGGVGNGVVVKRVSSEAVGASGGLNLTADQLVGAPLQKASGSDLDETKRKKSFGEGVKGKLKEMMAGGTGKGSENSSESSSPAASVTPPLSTPVVEVNGPAEVKKAARRTLYTANVGDARAVLSRGGKAVRLTYDHKGSDAQEAKRITDAGGFVMNNRVNGVLAVTRSLGDSSMKEFVVGSPYTTETSLGPDDDFLIVACDGLWDVCQDQEAVDIIRGLKDPQEASKALLDHALTNFSSDNLSVLVVALN